MNRADRFANFWALLDGLETGPDSESLYSPDTAAGSIRRQNLARYLDLMTDALPTLLLVGEAPGHRGTAITGVPFMSVRETTASPGLLSAAPFGDGFETVSDPVVIWEATSGAMWRTLDAGPRPLPLLWAAYPHHPHQPGNVHTNRQPTAAEVASGIPVVLALAAAFEIGDIVAVGRTAQVALGPHVTDLQSVRHPARGGERAFARQLQALCAESTHSP